MDITFDPEKNASNKVKHGYLLSDAELLDWDNMLVSEDETCDYSEVRFTGLTYGLAQLGDKIFSVCFTVSEDYEAYRVISLRLATKQEIKRYAET